MGNATYTHVLRRSDAVFIGRMKMIAGIMTMSSSYATGGDTIDLRNEGIWHVEAVVFNQPDGYILEWDKTNNKVKAYYPSGTPAMSNESAHTHAVALDSGASGAGSAHNHTASASTVNPRYQPDANMVSKPTIALTHNADPPTNLSANALYIVEADGEATLNNGRLESNCNGTADILGETANGAVGGVAASCRFFVKHNGTPNGVQLYINEASSDQLEFVSPTDTDAWLIMPFEGAAGAPPGCAVAVKVHDSDGAASGKALYFDDNGVADAQLAFVDTGAAGGTIPAADVVVLTPTYIGPAADNIGVGSAEAQAVANESAHTHGSGTLADAASGTGSAHTHTATAEVASEVGNGVNLSAVTAEVVIFGR